MEREKLNNLEQELYNYFKKDNIYPEYISCNNASVCPDIFIEIEYEIRGDWKHDHLYSEDLIRQFINEKNWVIVGTGGEMTEETGSDYYGAFHTFKVGINKEMALGIKTLIVGE